MIPKRAFSPSSYHLIISGCFVPLKLQRDGFNGGSKADKAERGLSKDQRKAERIAAIRSAIVYGGPLMIKNTKESMFKSSWKERYFVIASGENRTIL